MYPFECRVPKNSKGEIRRQQRKTIEWEKTRDLFKKTGDIKGTFHARMGRIKQTVRT